MHFSDHITIQQASDHITIQHGSDHITIQHASDHITIQHASDHITIQHGLNGDEICTPNTACHASSCNPQIKQRRNLYFKTLMLILININLFE